MKIAVSTQIQFSLFSSGSGGASLAVAEALRNNGNEVWLVNTNPSTTWWEDCVSLKQVWDQFLCKASDLQAGTIPGDSQPFDVFIEMDKTVFQTSEQRKKVAKKSVLVLRKAPILHDIEASLFPFEFGKRTIEGIDAVWCFNLNCTDDDLQYLECLFRVPASFVPFTWTPSIVEIYRAENRSPDWNFVTEKLAPGLDAPWSVHICETNNTAASSLTIPLVILRDMKKRNLVPIKTYKAHNADHVQKSEFFKQNVKSHCDHPDLSGVFVGRQRVADWVNDPKSCIISHMRFLKIRPYLLDAAWSGIPFIHNSPEIKRIEGYDRYYYPDNEIVEAGKALARMDADFRAKTGIFAENAIAAIRNSILRYFSAYSSEICAGWNRAISSVVNATPPPSPSAAVPAALPAATPSPPPSNSSAVRELSVLFTDMWDDFNPEYNMFTLLMNEAGRHLTPRVRVTGYGPQSLQGRQPNLVVFGPFGDDWMKVSDSIPKVHYTGENSGLKIRSDIKLNIGYQHADFKDQEYLRIPLWMFEIDWFGADKERLVNPKPLPIDRCTQVYPADLGRKDKFCAFVVTNPCNEIRNNSFLWLSQYKQVDSAGRLFNNIGDAIFAGRGGGGGELKKFEFLKDYKFCLTYENSSSQGYTTEKMLHAKAAGCIPIYWGDPKVERDFDLGGFIDARNFTRPEELIEAVRKVDSDMSTWMRMFSVPALDETRRDLVRRTLSECSFRLLRLATNSEEGLHAIPRFLGAATDKEAAEFAKLREGPAVPSPSTSVPSVAPPSSPTLTLIPNEKKTISNILVVTAATKRFLPSLHQLLVSIQAQKSDKSLDVRMKVWLGGDIDATTEAELKRNFGWIEFCRFPLELKAPGFDDLWEPQHFAWKLWILQSIASDPQAKGSLCLYLDSGIFMCRWPRDWLYIAKERGLCILEDPRETNDRWCHDTFCKELSVSEAEKKQQQIWAGAIAFECGHPLAINVFNEAWALGQKRHLIVGPKWEGVREGKPYGHRHDQSILSILTTRASVARFPMDLIYCDESLRRTFITKKALYVHRGGFIVHRPFSEEIDDCYVINLDRRADRMEKLFTNSPELKGRVQRVSAVEGRKLQLTPAIARLFRPHDFNWKKPVMGCALSHLRIWWQLANERDDINHYLILEDDAKLSPDWERHWKEAAPHLPEGFDVIYLGGILPPNRAGFETVKQKVNPYFSRVAENTVFGQNPPNRYFHWCAYSYVLSKQGARKILEILKTHDGYWTSADHMICNPVGILQMYFLDPLVAGCYQDDDPRYQQSAFNDFSRVDGFDSDLWNNNECFPKADSDALAMMDLPLDIQAALEDSQQQSSVIQVAENVQEMTVGSESQEQAKQKLQGELSKPNDSDQDWSPILNPTDATNARNHAFSMLRGWKQDWNQKSLSAFQALASAIASKQLTDLPKQEQITQLLGAFRLTAETLPEKEKGAVVLQALESLLSYGQVLKVPPKNVQKRRILAIREQNLKIEQIYERTWLQELFGKDFSLEIHPIGLQDPAPTDEPILLVMRPWLYAWQELLKKWQGVNYYILHLSDEHGEDPLTIYQSDGCLGVVRMYHREGLEQFGNKVLTIPLGYHWTKAGGMDDPEFRTPRLPFREYVWSFLGTKWNNRPEKMKNLSLIQPNRLVWFNEWNDAAMLGEQEYLNVLLNSRFVPTPGGQNPETYRFFEALECGCIPLYVRQDGDKGFMDAQVRKWIPLPDLPTWDHAAAMMFELSKNVQVMEGFRHACLDGWKRWKEDCKKNFKAKFNLGE